MAKYANTEKDRFSDHCSIPHTRATFFRRATSSQQFLTWCVQTTQNVWHHFEIAALKILYVANLQRSQRTSKKKKKS
jgi:hypothetical protein